MQYVVNPEPTLPDYFEYQRSKNVSCLAHVHSYLEIVFVLSGELTLLRESDTYCLQAGTMAIIMPYEIHKYDTQTASETVIITCAPEYLSEYGSEMDGKTFDLPHAPTDRTLAEMLSQPAENLFNSYRLKALLYYAVSIFTQTGNLVDKKFKNYDTYRFAVRYISEHYLDETLSLEAVAHRIGITRIHLSRLLNQRHGDGFSGIVNSLRIQYAKRLIEGSTLSLSEIAFQSGFGSIRNFNRIFQKTFGCSPTSIRNRSVSIPEVAYSEKTVLRSSR